MKKLLWSAGIAAFVAAGVLTGLPHLDTVSAEAAAPPVKWGKCPAAPAGMKVDPHQTCGTVSVPLDYRHPGGRHIDIAVSRIPATDPAKRRGVLLLNPGGPGGEGLNQPSGFDQIATKSELAAYDRIGFDPRGVGHSSPVTCGLTAEEMSPPYPFPAADGSIDQNVEQAKSIAKRCAAHSGDLLPYMTTANTARDMDRIRAALGERKISYNGSSYGTYLGAVYATLYPKHTDRMVLDSAIDPGKIWYGMFREQSKGMADRFPDAAAYAAEHADEVGFGATPEEVTSSFEALAGRLDTAPIEVEGAPFALDGNLLRSLTYSMLTQDAQLPPLTQVWRAAADTADGHPSAADTAALQQILAMADPGAATSPGVPKDNVVASAYAVTCDDVKWSGDVRSYARNVAKDRARYPLSAGFPANLWPCAFWPTKPVEAPVNVSDHGPRNIMILQNRRDPAAPLAAGRGMHRALGKRSSMVTVDAGGHGVYGNPGPDACATRAADAFLVDGRMPGGDVECGPQG